MAPHAQGDATATEAVDLLWAGPATGRRGPKPKYSLDAIADAAMAIADAEGLDAVTMQRTADRLGTTKMALYRYVPGRAELDAVMLDNAFGAPPAAAGDDWRGALAVWAGALHERSLARPWSVELAQRPHTPGPHELVWFERGLAAMAALPLSGGEKLDVLALLVGHVMSIVRQGADASDPEDALAAGLAPILAARAADYPHTASAFADAARGSERDRALSFGVERVLAGVASLVAERAASS